MEGPLIELVGVMRRLRAECAWKAEQTHTSLVRYLLEESHEVVDAIESGDADDLREELGDLLLQVYFHAAIAEESGEFTIDDVAAGLRDKLIRRNPHVFGPGSNLAEGLSAEDVNEVWEAVKATEKQRSSVTEGIAPTLPALLYADKVVERLTRAGSKVSGTVSDPAPEPDTDRDLGDRLLALVVEGHDAGLDPEQELRAAVRRLVAESD